MQGSRAVWVRDTDLAITAVCLRGTKAVSCPAVRSGVSWQELWCAAGVCRSIALMAGFYQEPPKQGLMPESHTFFADIHGTSFFSGHAVGRNSVSYWKLSVTWKYQEYDSPTFCWLPKRSWYSLVLDFTVRSMIWFQGVAGTLFLQCQVPQRWWGCVAGMLTLCSLPDLPNRNVRAAAPLYPLTRQRRGHQNTFILPSKKETLQKMYLVTHVPMSASASAMLYRITSKSFGMFISTPWLSEVYWGWRTLMFSKPFQKCLPSFEKGRCSAKDAEPKQHARTIIKCC